jgi:hypothetical protein
VGAPPRMPLAWPKPMPGNITATTATIAAATATAVEGFNADGLLIAFPLFRSGLVFHGATHNRPRSSSSEEHARACQLLGTLRPILR